MSRHFINGEWVAGAGGETLPVIDPSNAQVYDHLARGNARDIDRPVKAARAALAGPWGRMTATDRGRILHKMSALILADAENLAQGEARDTGQADRPGEDRHHGGRALDAVHSTKRKSSVFRASY